jgi:hypothetical protein
VLVIAVVARPVSVGQRYFIAKLGQTYKKVGAAPAPNLPELVVNPKL